MKLAEDVDAERSLQLVGRKIGDILDRLLMSGVVDEDIDLAERFNRFLDDSSAMILVGDVATHQDGAPASRLNPVTGFLRVLVFLQISDQNVCSLSRKRDRNGPS